MSAPRHAPAAEPRHVPLDGLRGVAVLVVMVMHFTVIDAATADERWFRSIVDTGWAGVDLFFVLSGFLITGILWDARGGSHYFRGFFMRRTLRIFPLYFAYLAVVLILLPLASDAYAAEHVPVDRRPWLWTYLGNVLMARVGWEGLPSHTTHLWSLAVEEQFYLLWPFLLAWVSRRGAVGLCIGAIVAASATRLLLTLGADWPVASYVLMPARLDTLAVGGLLALTVREPVARAFLARHSARVAGVAALLLATLAAWVGSAGTGGAALPALDARVQLLGYPLIAVACGALLVAAHVAHPRAALPRALSARALLVLGKYSYALYLLHIPLRNFVRGQVEARGGLPTTLGSQLPAQVVLIALCIGATLVLALASWHVLERPLLALKDRFPYDAPPRRAPAPTGGLGALPAASRPSDGAGALPVAVRGLPLAPAGPVRERVAASREP